MAIASLKSPRAWAKPAAAPGLGEIPMRVVWEPEKTFNARTILPYDTLPIITMYKGYIYFLPGGNSSNYAPDYGIMRIPADDFSASNAEVIIHPYIRGHFCSFFFHGYYLYGSVPNTSNSWDRNGRVVRIDLNNFTSSGVIGTNFDTTVARTRNGWWTADENYLYFIAKEYDTSGSASNVIARLPLGSFNIADASYMYTNSTYGNAKAVQMPYPNKLFDGSKFFTTCGGWGYGRGLAQIDLAGFPLSAPPNLIWKDTSYQCNFRSAFFDNGDRFVIEQTSNKHYRLNSNDFTLDAYTKDEVNAYNLTTPLGTAHNFNQYHNHVNYMSPADFPECHAKQIQLQTDTANSLRFFRVLNSFDDLKVSDNWVAQPLETPPLKATETRTSYFLGTAPGSPVITRNASYGRSTNYIEFGTLQPQ